MPNQSLQALEQWAAHPGVLAFIHAGHILGEGWGSWVDWGIVVSLILSIAILVLIICSRIFQPHRVIRGGALILNGLALVMLPTMLLSFATLTTFEYAKQINFCGSCHKAMAPYVHDLLDPNGRSLASLHYRIHFDPTQPGTACYSCHATYGVHGTFIAKLQGLSDAYRYITGFYTTPIKSTEPFPNKLCLKCHIDSSIFRSKRIHMDGSGHVSPLMLHDTISCEMCHPAGHMIGAPAQ